MEKRFAKLAQELLDGGHLGTADEPLSQIDFAPLLPGRVRVHWRDGPVAATIAVIAGWDWAPRKPRSFAAMMTQIDGLSTENQRKLFSAVAAWALRQDPEFAKKLGIAIDGDEIE